MRFQNPGSLGLTVWVFAITVLAVSFFGAGIKAQTELPDRVTVRGTVIDLNCASTGKALTGSWKNTELDHLMADGTIQKNCLEMCLKGGQPAALFSRGKITAVLACNPRGGGDIQRGDQHGNPHNLIKYAGAPVEVEGFWADEDTKLLVPVRIRRSIIHVESYFSRGGWHPVDCNRDGIPFNGTDMIGASPSEEHQH
ncbi:MAG: hypothetical protein IH917_07560 [Acidobacteria bacterium]|nr:hypothetical protein [Acidobacteriota bacterium]